MTAASIVIPFMTVDPWFEECLASVATQSMRDFEVVLAVNTLDQAIKEQATAIANNVLSPQNLRYVIVAEEKRGISHALNTAIAASSGKYVVRMDADDVMLPQRLFRQVSYLDKHPNVAALGSSALITRADGAVVGSIVAPKFNTSTQVLAALRYENPFVHPTMTIRRASLDGYAYDPAAMGCEDWRLWARLARAGNILTNMEEPLLRYRTHPKQESRVHNKGRADALRQTLAEVDPDLAKRYMFQRVYLESSPPSWLDIVGYPMKEARHINSRYSAFNMLKGLGRGLLRKCRGD